MTTGTLLKKNKKRRTYYPKCDLSRFCFQPNAHFEVYHKEGPFGIGPAASFHIHNQRVFKFDCFGEGGHYHTYMSYRHEPEHNSRRMEDMGRIMFYEKTIEEQLDRISFELLTNGSYYLLRSDDLRIRKFVLDQEKLKEGIEWMRDNILAFYQTVPKLRHLRWFKKNERKERE